MRRTWYNLILGLLVSLLVVGCGAEKKKKDGEAGDGKKDVITQKGSDTMILLAQKWSEIFGKSHPNIQVQVTGGGSGTGISALINGTTDIANSSRPMKDEEKKQIKEKFGSDVVEIAVATDGIAVYVHESNPLDSLTIAQLRDIYVGKITNWKQIGGPDQKVILYGRENSSGTYSYFKEHVLKDADFTPATQSLPGTAAVVNSVAKDKMGIGYGGEAYTKGVKQVKLVGDQGVAMAPTEANVLSGSYPLSRKLYFYLRNQPSGTVNDYVQFVLSDEGQALAKEAGYYPVK
jgi:phosphate transport system substrate-binding protein